MLSLFSFPGIFRSSLFCTKLGRAGLQSTRRGALRVVTGRRNLLTQSYVEGSTSIPLLRQSIPEHFASIVAQHGDRTAVISRAQSTRLTYRELDERSTALARGLKSRGVSLGERVAVCAGNGWEFAVATYAIYKLGAVLVPLNPAFSSPQVIAALNHLEAKHLIVAAETNLPFKPSSSNGPLLEALIPDLTSSAWRSESVPSLQNVILINNTLQDVAYPSTIPFSELWRPSSEREDFSKLHQDDIATIQFTSGTTSSPKAAMLTHKNILNNGFLIGERMGYSPEDVVCCPPPLFHCFGCVLGYMATATHGSAILFPTEAFNPAATLLAIQEESATALYGVATMFVAELELLAKGHIPNRGFESLRTGIAAGSSVPGHLMEKVHRVLKMEGKEGLMVCYGMTETSPVSFMTAPSDPLEKRINTVGRIMSHTHAKIIAPSSSSHLPLPINTRGELLVSGYLVMKEYFNDPIRTQENQSRHPHHLEAEDDDVVWMHTGDEASMDEEGYVTITGRIKDLIIRGGENISPAEIENCLFGHENVAEVSIVGVKDERYGEVVAAFVVKGNTDGPDQNPVTKEDLRVWVGERLGRHLRPKYIFWRADAFPKTASGKIMKFVLREEAEELVKKGEGLE